MRFTKKVVATVLVAGLLAGFLVVPHAAEAGGRQWNRGGYGHHHHHSGPGPFWGGLAVGAVTGVVVGSILAPRVYAAPPPVVYQPVPVVVQPVPVCTNYYMPTYWNGYQWVQGYWTQACR